jgi:hypothetical protein
MESVGDLLAAIRDPRIAELGRRRQAAALSVVAPEPAPAPTAEQDDQGGGEGAPSSLRLVDPHRACIETNLTRRGFWVGVAGGARQLTLPLHGEDRFGTFTVEACSRWRELDEPNQRRVPLSLRRLAADFGRYGRPVSVSLGCAAISAFSTTGRRRNPMLLVDCVRSAGSRWESGFTNSCAAIT